jgi:hypothetical protein
MSHSHSLREQVNKGSECWAEWKVVVEVAPRSFNTSMSALCCEYSKNCAVARFTTAINVTRVKIIVDLSTLQEKKKDKIRKIKNEVGEQEQNQNELKIVQI